MMKRNNIFPLTAISAGLVATFSAYAAEIPTNTAQMQAMDKITGRVSVINVPVNSEVTFGSFSIVVRDCKTRSPEETPENYAFVDVVDTTVGQENVNIFKGWMLSSSPALNAVEHPVYDVWLLKCIDTDISQTTKLSADALKARDAIPLLRSTSANQAPQIIPVQQNENVNLSGEPIDLLPASIREAGEEDAAQEEVIKLEIIDETPTAESENAPQSLLNNTPKTEASNNEPQEINAKIEITEQATGAQAEIKSDARVLNAPEIKETPVIAEPVAEQAPVVEPVAPAEPQNLIPDTAPTETPVSEPTNIVQPSAEAEVPAPVVEPTSVPDEPQNLIPNTPEEISAPLVEPTPVAETVVVPESVPAEQPVESDPIAELEKQLSIEALNN